MLRYFVRRVVGSLFSIFGASIVAFVCLRLFPGNPADLLLGPLASKQALHVMSDQMGIGKPLWTEYWRYIDGFFTGHWGFSYTAGQSVAAQIGARAPASLELGMWAFVFALVPAVALALLSTYRHRPVIDGVTRIVGFIGLGTPQFWLALLLLLTFFSWLGIFPGPEGQLSPGTALPPKLTGLVTVDSLLAGQWTTFANAVWHVALPAVSLGLAAFSFLVRLLRSHLLEVSREPFLVVVRSKGLSRLATHTRHAFPNALLPTLTASGLLFANMIAGSVLVEKVFNWPGIGALVADSILRKDFSVVQVFILLSACAYVVINLVVDVLYGVIDPRVRDSR